MSNLFEWSVIVHAQHMQGVAHPDLHALARRLGKPRTTSLLVLCAFMSHARTCPCLTSRTRAWADKVYTAWPNNLTKHWCRSSQTYRDCYFCKRGDVRNWDMGDSALATPLNHSALLNTPERISRKRKPELDTPLDRPTRYAKRQRLEDEPAAPANEETRQTLAIIATDESSSLVDEEAEGVEALELTADLACVCM